MKNYGRVFPDVPQGFVGGGEIDWNRRLLGRIRGGGGRHSPVKPEMSQRAGSAHQVKISRRPTRDDGPAGLEIVMG